MYYGDVLYYASVSVCVSDALQIVEFEIWKVHSVKNGMHILLCVFITIELTVFLKVFNF
jgi:hypothetical protein